MKLGIYNFHKIFNSRNRVFEADAYTIGENLGYPLLHLREELQKLGHSLDTLDQHPLNEFDKIIFLDLPDPSDIDLSSLRAHGCELHLIILESPIVRPDNLIPANHRHFSKVFTWSDDLVAEHPGGNYLKLPIAHKFPAHVPQDILSRRQFCAMIVSNKLNSQAGELYTQRYELALWFQKNQPQQFDLYGYGWDQLAFSSRWIRKIAKRSHYLKQLFAPKHSVYRGTVKSKREVLSRYSFAVAYENVCGFRGYITEKMFDCLFSGTIPIYWGAPNIEDYVPKSCFIDRRDFRDNQHLYEFLRGLTDTQLQQYQQNGAAFLQSEAGSRFSSGYFVKAIINALIAPRHCDRP